MVLRNAEHHIGSSDSSQKEMSTERSLNEFLKNSVHFGTAGIVYLRKSEPASVSPKAFEYQLSCQVTKLFIFQNGGLAIHHLQDQADSVSLLQYSLKWTSAGGKNWRLVEPGWTSEHLLHFFVESNWWCLCYGFTNSMVHQYIDLCAY